MQEFTNDYEDKTFQEQKKKPIANPVKEMSKENSSNGAKTRSSIKPSSISGDQVSGMIQEKSYSLPQDNEEPVSIKNQVEYEMQEDVTSHITNV